MTTIRRSYQSEDDFWRIRNFLREVFLLNDRREHSWHVARLDYWRWHIILNCHYCGPVEQVTSIWETADGTIAAVLHPIGDGELRFHVHPHFRTVELETEMVAFAEEHLAIRRDDGARVLYLPVDSDDELRHTALLQRQFVNPTAPAINGGAIWDRPSRKRPSHLAMVSARWAIVTSILPAVGLRGGRFIPTSRTKTMMGIGRGSRTSKRLPSTVATWTLWPSRRKETSPHLPRSSMMTIPVARSACWSARR